MHAVECCAFLGLMRCLGYTRALVLSKVGRIVSSNLGSVSPRLHPLPQPCYFGLFSFGRNASR